MASKNKKDYTGTIVSIDNSGNVVRTTPKTETNKNTVTKVNSNTSNLVSTPTVTAKTTVPKINSQQLANKNYNDKLSIFNKASEAYDKKRIEELNKNNIDLTRKLDKQDFRNNVQDGRVVNKKTMQEREKQYEQFQPKLEELTQAEHDAKRKAKNDLNLAVYQKAVADVDNEKVTLGDQFLYPFVSGVGDYFSQMYDYDEYVDENGKTMYLPSFNDLMYQKVRESYGDSLLGKGARFFGDTTHELGKQAASSILNTVPYLGTGLYFTDIIADQYKQNINEGYDEEKSMKDALLKGGANYIKQKIIGGLGGKLTNSDSSWLEKTLTNKWANIVSNPRAVSMLSSMSAEAIDEFTDTFVEAGIDAAVLGKEFDGMDLLKDAAYSGLIGAGTGAGNNAAGQVIQMVANKLNKQNALNNQNTVQNNINEVQDVQPTTQTETPQIQTKQGENKNTQLNTEQAQVDLKQGNNEVSNQTVENKPTIDIKTDNKNTQTTPEQLSLDLENTNNDERNGLNEREYNEIKRRYKDLIETTGFEEDFNENATPEEMLGQLKQIKEAYEYDGFLEQARWEGGDVLKNTKNEYAKINRFINRFDSLLNKDNSVNTQTENVSSKVEQTQPQVQENNNVPEVKNEDVITLKSDNSDTKSSTSKAEDTGVSINGKRVQIEVPTNSHKNKLGQNITNNIDTKKVKKGDGDSKFYDTVTERSKFVKQEVKDKISNDDFIKHYDKITNEKTLDKVINKLGQEGTQAISEFFASDKQLTPEDTAMGIVLFEQAQQNGDYDMANKVLRKLRENGTTTGQILQLYSLFSRMTPEGMYKWAGDQLLKAEEIFEKNKSKKWIKENKNRWQLNPNEVKYLKSQMEKVQKLNNSTDKMAEVSLSTYGQKDNGKTIKVTKERATQLEIAKIQKLIENKIPPEKGQGLKAWMRISMLGNPKTIGTRNPLGNLLIKPVNDVGDVLGTILDKAISSKTGVRTKGTPQIASSIEGFVRGGKESIQDYKVGVNTRDIKGNRFEVGQGKSFNEQHKGILANQRNEVSKILNKMDNGVSFVLDFGDRPFYEMAFENSLSNQMELNGIDDVKNAPKWMLENAQQEALERTWQDDNNYTKGVLNVRKALNDMIHVGDYGIGDVLIPFAKTPANLTKAIVDYSPVGVAKALVQGNNLRKSINNGQFTPQMQHQFVNQLGKAMAGSMLYVLASGLVNAGVITGKEDEDKDVADFMKNTLGIQPYSIKIGDKSFTYDWAQPVAAPFAIMADLDKTVDSSKEEKDLTFVLKSAISSAGAILLEQSFLEGIKDVLGGYGDPVDNLLSEIEGLPARAVPTFFQQIATLIDGKQRMSYGNDGISNITSQAKAKVPGLASDLPVKRNTLGQEVERYGGENNVFNVFFNPANYSQGRATESAKEIYRVYQATNDKTILPRTVSNTIRNEDGTKLTNAQKSEFLKISGGIVDDNIKKLKNNKDYQNMSDVDKAAVIKKIVDYAYNKAREQVTNHELASEYKKADQASETGYALYDYYATKQSTKQTNTTSSKSSSNRYQEMKALGIDGETFDRFKAFVKTAKGESRTGGLTKKQKIINWINAQNLTKQQKQNLYNDYVENSKVYSSYN